MRVEKSGARIRYNNRVAIGGVREVMADFGNQSVAEGEGVEDGGDEGGGAAESLGDDDAVADDDVVAVVAGEEAPALGELLLVPHHGRGGIGGLVGFGIGIGIGIAIGIGVMGEEGEGYREKGGSNFKGGLG
ncbi:hypothetical protein TIFTF001_000250 [Ficus carica]|uniref:Uncharacterized protein n=1 Tax=Ficus carica TaxID=3494 RepID=A0AA88CJM1_FICCA|nr:hypothetical protein TIFTF001_000250 [Ficus carica]